MARQESKVILLLNSLDDPRLLHASLGILAFVSYQLVAAGLFQTLGLARNLRLIPFELLVFALVTTCLSLYSDIVALRTEQLTRTGEHVEEERRLQSARIAARLSKKLGTFCPKNEKSSAPVMSGISFTLLSPATRFKDTSAFAVSSGLLYVTG